MLTDLMLVFTLYHTIVCLQADLPVRDPNIDFPASMVATLWSLTEEAYGYIVTEYTQSELL